MNIYLPHELRAKSPYRIAREADDRRENIAQDYWDALDSGDLIRAREIRGKAAGDPELIRLLDMAAEGLIEEATE